MWFCSKIDETSNRSKHVGMSKDWENIIFEWVQLEVSWGAGELPPTIRKMFRYLEMIENRFLLTFIFFHRRINEEFERVPSEDGCLSRNYVLWNENEHPQQNPDISKLAITIFFFQKKMKFRNQIIAHDASGCPSAPTPPPQPPTASQWSMGWDTPKAFKSYT